jgi:hypothetical protein
MAAWVEKIRRAAARFGEEKHMTKTKEPQQSSVAACEHTLQQLEVKRAKHVERGRELPELRAGAAYLAHTERHPGARRTLNQVNAELATHESELAAIDAAISEAKNRILIAQAIEADVADKARAKEALALFGEFKQCGVELDAAFRTIAEKGNLLGDLLGRLHACGIKNPTAEQVDVLGYSCLQTSLMATVWNRRFRFLGPSQRRHFGPLFAEWAASAERRLRGVLAEDEAEGGEEAA